MKVKYPHIQIDLGSIDGNAFSLLGATRAAMRRGKVPEPEIEEFMKEAMSGNYEHLVQTIMQTIETISPDDSPIGIKDEVGGSGRSRTN